MHSIQGLVKETKRTYFLITASCDSAYFVDVCGQSGFLLQSNIQSYHKTRHFTQNGTEIRIALITVYENLLYRKE